MEYDFRGRIKMSLKIIIICKCEICRLAKAQLHLRLLNVKFETGIFNFTMSGTDRIVQQVYFFRSENIVCYFAKYNYLSGIITSFIVR